MAGTVTALKIQKHNKERVNVFVDDEFALAVTILVATTLKKGQHLSDVEIEHLKQGDERDKAYDRAVHFLGFRPRSQSEVERYLRDKGYDAPIIDDTIRHLIDKQYVNDEAFATFWLENREQFKPRGARALRYELRQKGLADNVIDNALQDLEESELAWDAVQSKLRRWQNLSEEQFRKKLLGFLSRRGFNYDTIRDTLERAQAQLDLSEPSEPWE